MAFNVWMPVSWVAAVGREARKRAMDRSAWIREAIKTYFPVLAAADNDAEKLKA
jgi:hypothetical protein